MKAITFALALVVTTATPMLRAADADAKTARRSAAGAGAGRIMEGLEELGLNDDQKARLKEFMQENGEKLRSLRDDQSGSREDRMRKFQDFQESMKSKMKEVLTPEQFSKWEKQRAAGPGLAAGAREGMQKLMESLNLTAEQQEKVRAAMREQGETMQSLRNASPEERREKFQKMQETMTAKMKEILSAEQFEKYEKAAKEMRGRLGGEAPARKRGNL